MGNNMAQLMDNGISDELILSVNYALFISNIILLKNYKIKLK